jgi:hypothetical protein
MKKLFFLAASLWMTLASFGQSDKFMAAMTSKLSLIDSNNSADTWKDMANSFERIADAEKTQWLPYYYASYCNIQAAYSMLPKDGSMGDNTGITDPLADKAETLLNKAEALSKDNGEIFVIWKMVHGLRMMGNPMARYMTESPKANEALEKAKALNANIPRIYILEAQDKYFTPEQFGGSKEEAKVLFEKALALFGTFKPEKILSPNWGKPVIEYFLAQYK